MGTPQRKSSASRVETQLVVYAAACKALAAARTTNEVRRIRDEAAMLRAYAKQAKNKQLELDAAEIRIRAERRVGELMTAQKQTVGLAKGTAGKGRPTIGGSKRVPPNDATPTLAEAGIDKHLAARARKLVAVPEKKFETLITDWRGRSERNGERVTTDVLRPTKLDVHHSSETPEHYTPAVIINAAIACLGAIDLDPCSNAGGPPNVPAGSHYTAADDGLSKDWNGTVYMNPPYGREIDRWIAKLCHDHEHGGVTEALALLPARTDTQWFIRLRDFVCCFVAGRLTFVGNDDPAPFPSAVFYLGEDIAKFQHHFAGIGDIWQRIEPGMFGE